MCVSVCIENVLSQWNRFRAGNCFYHCRVKVWLAWHTGTRDRREEGGVSTNGPNTHNPLAAGHSSHSSHYSTQWGTNNQNNSFSANCGSTCWTQIEDIFVSLEKFKCEGYWKWSLPRRRAPGPKRGWMKMKDKLWKTLGWSKRRTLGRDRWETGIWSLHKLSWITQGWSV